MKILVIDGSNAYKKAEYAMPSLKNSKGQEVGAIRGWFSQIQRLIRQVEATHVITVFDKGGLTRNHKLDKAYKSNRQPYEFREDEAFQQKEIKRIMRACGSPVLGRRGIEADDIIASLALTIKREGYQCYIYSSDKDFLQLVCAKIKIVVTSIRGSNYIREKYGIEPKQMVDWLSLTGDSIDCIPGLQGCGPKTATKILQQFGSISNIDDATLSPSLRSNFINGFDRLMLNRRMIRLRTTYPVFLPEKRFYLKRELLQELEINL